MKKNRKWAAFTISFISFLFVVRTSNVESETGTKEYRSAVSAKKSTEADELEKCNKSWQKTIDKQIVLGFSTSYDKLPEITFAEISKAEFDHYKSAYRPKLDPRPSRIKFTKTTFIIGTDKTRLTFYRENKNLLDRHHTCWMEYMGYYPDLKLHALIDASVAEGIGFGTYVLVDGDTNTAYSLASMEADGAVETPLISPRNTYLAYYQNSPYKPDTFIGLIRITGHPKQYKEYASFSSREYKEDDRFNFVEDLVWIDDDAFAVKAARVVEFSEARPNLRYFKTINLRDAKSQGP